MGPATPPFFASRSVMSWFVLSASVLFGNFGLALGCLLGSKKSLLAVFRPLSLGPKDVRFCSISVSLRSPRG